MEIPFYHRYRPEGEASLLAHILEGELATEGEACRRVRELIARRWGLTHVLPTPSCTHGLELACHLLKLRRGDEVVVPSFNFPSGANAVLLAGGVPILCDINPHTQTLSLEDVSRKITSRTRAVMAVHYAGISCDMDALGALCDSGGIHLIEDAAQGADAYYKGKALGSFGRFGAYSFHHTKNFSCGEGGALVCGEDDLRLGEIFREKGTDRTSYLRGERSLYRWVNKGSSYLLSEPCAALLLTQLESGDIISQKLRRNLTAYQAALEPLEKRGFLRRMNIPAYSLPNGHIYYIRFPTKILRDKGMALLRAKGVECHTHFAPLHLSPMGKALPGRSPELPESQRAWETLLRLPIHTAMGESQVAYVAEILERGLTL